MAMRGDISYLVYRYAMDAASRMVNARLQELQQSANPPFIAAEVEDGDFMIARTKKSFGAQVVSSEQGLKQAVTTVYREMLRAARCGFTDSEYERAKAQILADVEAAYNGRDKKKSADYCKEYVRHFIDNEPIPGEENNLAIVRQLAENINAETVGKILSQMVSNNQLVLSAMLPDKKGVNYPAKEEMEAALAAVTAETITPYEDAVSDEPLMSTLPTPGKVTKSEPSAMGYRKYALSNGATLYFRQTDFNPNEILMTAVSKGGKSLYPVTMAADLKVLNEVMTVGGLGNFSTTDLHKVLAGRKVSVTPKVGTFDETINASSTPKDFETMLQLNYLYFTALRSYREAFDSWLVRERASVANRASNPMSALQDSVQVSVNTVPDMFMGMQPSDIDRLDYDNIMKIARERFANAADFTFIVTGAIDETTLLPLVERYVASLPANGKREEANPEADDFSKGKVSNVFKRKMEVPMVTNVFFDNGTADYTLKNKLAFDIALNALSVVLLEEIREKEGGTYGIGAYGELIPLPAPRVRSYMQIAYQTNPDKYEYLNQRVRDIVKQFVKEGPSEANLAKGKEFFLKNHRESLRENSYWATTLKTWLDTSADFSADFEQTLQGITAEDARQSIEQLLQPANHAEVIMVGVDNK